MGLNLINRLGPLRPLILSAWRWDAQNKYKRFQQVLNPGERIVDVGSGYGTVTQLLREKQFEVIPVDVNDQSYQPELSPVIYDGRSLPFKAQELDTALLLTVLHHTPNPEQVLAEAMRVSKKLIVIEDVYKNSLQKYLTFFADSFFNFEFRGHPHSNKTRKGWEQCCHQLGLRLKVIRSDRFLLFFRQETYLIQPTAVEQASA